MGILNEQEKRDMLKDVLIELSKSQDALKGAEERASYFARLEAIYWNCDSEENFRHYYSDIFSTLSLIDGDASIGSLDILAQNIQTVKDAYISKNTDGNGTTINIRKEIAKLYDHTNLDIARINYTKTMTNGTMSELAKTRLFVEKLKDNVRESEDEVRELYRQSQKTLDDMFHQVQKRQENMQKEYITILGIFAAIVLAFTGGIVFSSSVLENMHKASIYRVSFIAFVIGLVFFNLIWILLDFIRDMNGGGTRRKTIWLAVNFILICGMAGICFSYQYGWFLPT